MDVTLDSETTSPEEYEPFRARVRAFIKEKTPHHGNNRGPETPEQLLALVGFLREFRAAGYPLTTAVRHPRRPAGRSDREADRGRRTG